MNLRPLVIGDAQRADIQRVKDYAEKERYSIAELRQRVEQGDSILAIGDDPGHTCILPVGYRVVYSIEEQPAPLNWCSHISISVISGGKWPNEAAILEICKSFGHDIKPGKCASYAEDQYRAVNFLFPHVDPTGE